MGGIPPQQMGGIPPAAPPPTSPQLSLADFFVRKLTEIGPMSKDDLRNLAIKEGYFPDAESAGQRVDATLLDIVREDRIRRLADETFVSSPQTQVSRLRKVS